MPIRNRLTQTLGIEHPVLLAPMDAVSGGRLAAAVSHAGGLGLLGGGYGDTTGSTGMGARRQRPDWLRLHHLEPRQTSQNCWTACWPVTPPRSCSLSATHAPSPPPYTRSGAKLICQVQTVAQAREAAAAGADVIVAQGTEAGGHGQSEPLFTLLPQVVDACPDIPIVAAGGIADGRGLAAAMMFGAEGVLIGTRFYASQEADGHPEAKRRIVAATGGQTVRSIVFDLSRRNRWPDPYTGRVLRNQHADRWLGHEAELEATRSGRPRLRGSARTRRL